MDRHRLRHLAASSLLVIVAAGLAGCGGDGDAAGVEEPSSTPSSEPTSTPEQEEVPADAPDCSTVWEDGKRLARTYRGCVDDAGAYVEKDTLGCSSGQRMVTYADQFYGVLGGTVHEAVDPLDEDDDYQDALRRCSA